MGKESTEKDCGDALWSAKINLLLGLGERSDGKVRELSSIPRAHTMCDGLEFQYWEAERSRSLAVAGQPG